MWGGLPGPQTLGPSALRQEFKHMLWFAMKPLHQLTDSRKTWASGGLR